MYLKFDFDYGTTQNNGRLYSQTITFPTVGINTGFTAVQSYTYDSLNRIKDAMENVTPHGGSSSQSWKQTFTYDRFGNRNFDEEETTTLPKECNGNTEVCEAIRPIVNPSINTANNRLNGYIFDASGNTIEDAQGRQFTYDAESKQVEVKDDKDETIGQYYYDGDGKRVKKVVPDIGEVTIFVYDLAGKLVAEYSTVVETVNAQVAYLTNDHLGSPRVNTDRDGNIISRRDFHPFGDEIVATERTGALGYASDSVRQKFTTYERDIETDLVFPQARIYANKLGRFTTVDDFTKDSYPNDAQSWNKYIYVRNNPLNLIDPTGEKAHIDIQIDQLSKVITLTVTASIGLWSKPNARFKPDLAKIQMNVEAQIRKWAGTIKVPGGYTLDVQIDVRVLIFESARSTDDVLKANNTIMNVIQLVDRPAEKECGKGSNSCIGGGDAATIIKNPDGTLPDIGTWRYTTARDKNEPAHEFFHILGKSHNDQEEYGEGWTGNPFAEQGTTNTTRATRYDYDRAFGEEVTEAIIESKNEKRKWPWQPKRSVIIRPTKVVRCCTP